MTPVVLDLTRLLPGPLTGRMLASLGYRVVRVLSPRGDLTETAAPELYRWLAEGKETITLDLKTGEGKQKLLVLVRDADILLESNLPGAMERMNLGPDTLRQVNPKLVYVRVGGYAAPNESLPGHDLTYLAAAGLLERMQDAWKHVQLADLCGAFWAVIAALEGLRKGGGFYEVHLANAVGAAAYPEPPLVDGNAVCYGVYECADGKVALAALEAQLWSRFCEATEREDWRDEAFTEAEDANAIYRDICEMFRSRTAADWEQWAAEKHLPLRAVRGIACAEVSGEEREADNSSAELHMPPWRSS